MQAQRMKLPDRMSRLFTGPQYSCYLAQSPQEVFHEVLQTDMMHGRDWQEIQLQRDTACRTACSLHDFCLQRPRVVDKTSSDWRHIITTPPIQLDLNPAFALPRSPLQIATLSYQIISSIVKGPWKEEKGRGKRKGSTIPFKFHLSPTLPCFTPHVGWSFPNQVRGTRHHSRLTARQ